MFSIVHANALAPLLDALAEELRERPLGPMEREQILVPSLGLRRWLTLGLAERLGSLAFCEMPLPARFAQALCTQVLGEEETPGYERDALRWRIWRLLGESETLKGGPLEKYLEEDPAQSKRYQLAKLLAARFDEYLLYRPELILAWEAEAAEPPKGPEERWQRQLWLRLLAELGPGHLARRLLQAIQELEGDYAGPSLPRRISAFGLTTLPPAFLHLLRGLSRHCQLTLYWMAPRGEQGGAPAPLAESLGRLSNDFEGMLAELASDTEIEQRSLPRVIPRGEELLPRLQRCLLAAEPEAAAKWPIAAADRSLVVHRTYSPRRELEVLREEILAALDADPTLRPSDVVVLLANPKEHAPFVDAVFGREHGMASRLPYHLSDRSLDQSNALAQCFAALLELPDTRLEREQVLGFLRRSPVRRRFAFDEELTLDIGAWCEELQLRWGIDGEERREDHALPEYEGNSWRAALDRLLLGHACGDLEDPLLDTLPAALAGEGRAAELGRFLDFTELLFRRVREWRRGLRPEEWAISLRDTALALLAPGDEREEAAMRLLLEEIAAFGERCQEAGIEDALPLAAVREELLGRIADERHGSPFLDGRLCVAELKPMRSIPFRMICVAGLEQESFPRSDQKPSFDLIGLTGPREGDRSLRGDDRYLFLETVLAAGQRLVLSYTAFSSRDGSERPPSVVLAELFDMLDEQFRAPGEELVPARDFVQIDHPLHPTSARYFDGKDPRLFSYRQDHVDASKLSLAGSREDAPWFSEALPVPEDASGIKTVELADLARFWQHPCAYFLRERLHLVFPRDGFAGDEREPFDLKQLTRYRAGDELLRRRWRRGAEAKVEAEEERKLLSLRGELPAAGLGLHAYELMAEGLELPGEFLAGAPLLDPQSFELKLGEFRLVGALDGLHAKGRIALRFGALRPQDRISLWIQHIVLGACVHQGIFEHPLHSRLVGRDETSCFAGYDEGMEDTLLWLLQYFFEGQERPLPLLPYASAAYAEQEKKLQQGKRADKDPLAKAREAWKPSEFAKVGNDSEDRALQLCFRGRDPFTPAQDFIELARGLWSPLLRAETSTPWRELRS
ncbi:MAG: hypothetical protein CSA62_08360 [Planctomycetota bacterium]|nr:MAG: hypothetical protein CSA62_08360 [Planctomycetota bacterium]